MDFFETQERYRRREMRGWFAMLFRVAIVVGALWFGWVWGKAEQSSLQAEADLVIYENNVRISELSNEVQSLQRSLAETKAAGTAKSVTGERNVALRRIIAKKIAAGVKPEQIIASMQGLGTRELQRNSSRGCGRRNPTLCWSRVKDTLFDGGLKLHVREAPAKRPSEIRLGSIPVSRFAFGRFSGEPKIESGVVPLETIIPTEDWILKLRFEKASLHGYVTSIISSCILR